MSSEVDKHVVHPHWGSLGFWRFFKAPAQSVRPPTSKIPHLTLDEGRETISVFLSRCVRRHEQAKVEIYLLNTPLAAVLLLLSWGESRQSCFSTRVHQNFVRIWWITPRLWEHVTWTIPRTKAVFSWVSMHGSILYRVRSQMLLMFLQAESISHG